MRVRLVVGTNPKAAIETVAELFPDEKTLEDKEHLETQTEVVKIAAGRPSVTLMSYLRSVLQNNYQGGDQEYLMISSPRVPEYELMVVSFAISLLEHYGSTSLLKRSTLDEDRLLFSAETDPRRLTVL